MCNYAIDDRAIWKKYPPPLFWSQGTGFIGSHIAEFLLNVGAVKVRVSDNQDTAIDGPTLGIMPILLFLQRKQRTCWAVSHAIHYGGLLKSAGWYWAYLPQFEAEAEEKMKPSPQQFQ